MFLGLVFVAIVLVVLLAGGRLSRLATVRPRCLWLLPLALGLQILVTEVTRADRVLDDALHVLSYLLAAAFLVLNRRIPGLLLIGLGAASNGIAIALNGGELPASARALRAAGIQQQAGDFANSGHVGHPVLGFLGDIAATPAFLPLRNVISVGDVAILLGAAWLIVAVCGTRWTRGDDDLHADPHDDPYDAPAPLSGAVPTAP
jgi:hypothetical protein